MTSSRQSLFLRIVGQLETAGAELIARRINNAVKMSALTEQKKTG